MNPHDLNRQQVEQASTQISYVYINIIIIIRHHIPYTVYIYSFFPDSLSSPTLCIIPLL